MQQARNRVPGWVAILLLAAGSSRAAGAPELADEDDLRPGLRATFARLGAEPAVVRIVPDLSARWGNASPDPRVPADGFTGHWTGALHVQSTGTYRFHARTDGTIVLKVAGRVVLEGTEGAVRSSPADLSTGFATIELEYRHDRGDARVAIDWEGPDFGREPLPARFLYHAPGGPEPTDRFEAGRRLADRLGCANCHRLLDLPRHSALGPPLTEAGSAIAPRWLLAWLGDTARVRPRARMPSFGRGLAPSESRDLAAFLASVAKVGTVSAEVRMALNVADPAKGRLLFRSLGCLGCHARGQSADAEDRAAPDLADLPWKRTPAGLAAYLQHPKTGRAPAGHRADLRLNADESAHLAAYLTSDAETGGVKELPALDAGAAGDPRRGRDLAETLRCAACHEIPGLNPPKADLTLRAGTVPDRGCLADQPAAPHVPRYDLTGTQRLALRELVAKLPRDPAPTSAQARAEDAIRRRDCLGCHVREGAGATGMGARLAALIGQDRALGGLKGTLTPPNLTAVGDKLRPEYLALAIRGEAPTARPWLSVRMPAFSFEAGEADAIAAYFQSRDRMTETPDPPDDASGAPDAATIERATALIGQRGFGCVSCHVLAGRVPPGGEPETLGPDLALAHRRMTKRYFERWIGDPQRIIAGTPMPRFLLPVATAPGPLAAQLATVWRLLGSPRVAEAAAAGTREILKRQGDRALVVRDMVLVPEAPETPYTPRGVAIGLKNDHSLLFDADRLTWLAWWRGGFLSRTKSARLWEWHPEGERIWTALERLPPVVLLGPGGQAVPPVEIRERFGTFDELDFEGSGVRLVYRLHAHGDGLFAVEERIEPVHNGWERSIRVKDVPETYRPALVDFSRARATLTIGEAEPPVPLPLALSRKGGRASLLTREPDGSYRGRVRLQANDHP